MADEDLLDVSIETGDDSDALEVPATLVDMLAEGDEAPPEVLGDIVLFGLAQRAHAAVHHAEGQPDGELEDAEAATMELFEERFGMTYGEATGHSH
jgi:hypothetical protein